MKNAAFPQTVQYSNKDYAVRVLRVASSGNETEIGLSRSWTKENKLERDSCCFVLPFCWKISHFLPHWYRRNARLLFSHYLLCKCMNLSSDLALKIQEFNFQSIDTYFRQQLNVLQRKERSSYNFSFQFNFVIIRVSRYHSYKANFGQCPKPLRLLLDIVELASSVR